MAYRRLSIQDLIYGAPLVFIAVVFTSVLVFLRPNAEHQVDGPKRASLQLMLGMALTALALLLTSPVLAVRLAITFLVFASLAGGAALGAFAPWCFSSGSFALKRFGTVTVGVLVVSGLLNVWSRTA